MKDRIRLQPLIDLHSSVIYGYEALYRKKSENSRYPSAITIMKHIFSVGQWAKSKKLFVNTCTRDITNASFADELLYLLQRANVDSNDIVLEINETLSPKILQQAETMLSILQENGIAIALDDFGIQNSLANFIKNMNPDIIKIDQQFVQSAPNNTRAMISMELFVQAAHHAGCKVVAEGIETQDQLQCVQKAGADVGQGFVFHRTGMSSDAPFVNLYELPLHFQNLDAA